MTSIKLTFRELSGSNRRGSLYFQVIHNRCSRRVFTGIHLALKEWDTYGQCLATSAFVGDEKRLASIHRTLAEQEFRLRQAVRLLEAKAEPFSTDGILRLYRLHGTNRITFFQFAERQIARLRDMGRERTAECYQSAVVALRAFIEKEDISELRFDMMDSTLIEFYEAYLRRSGLCRNTISFYLRNLRSIYNKAAREGLIARAPIFDSVYTGVDRTPKRAISLADIRILRRADLSAYPILDFARDMFLFSFLTRGMSFIDMAHLQARNISGGYLTYVRRKTGQQLTIKWRREMQQIVDKHSSCCPGSVHLLPIIPLGEDEQEGAAHRRLYLTAMQRVNRNLGFLGKAAKLPVRLTMYVARHSWASAAQEKRVPTVVISHGMGHDSEKTTEIYLSSIQSSKIDEANDLIISSL